MGRTQESRHGALVRANKRYGAAFTTAPTQSFAGVLQKIMARWPATMTAASPTMKSWSVEDMVLASESSMALDRAYSPTHDVTTTRGTRLMSAQLPLLDGADDARFTGHKDDLQRPEHTHRHTRTHTHGAKATSPACIIPDSHYPSRLVVGLFLTSWPSCAAHTLCSSWDMSQMTMSNAITLELHLPGPPESGCRSRRSGRRACLRPRSAPELLDSWLSQRAQAQLGQGQGRRALTQQTCVALAFVIAMAALPALLLPNSISDKLAGTIDLPCKIDFFVSGDSRRLIQATFQLA